VPPPVQNSLLASTAGHPFWQFLLELCVARGAKGSLQNVRATTGVDLIALANYAYNAKAAAQKGNGTCVLEKEKWHGDPQDVADGIAPPPKYVLHHGTSSWRTGWAFVAEGCKTIGSTLGDPICYVLFRYGHFVSKPYYLIAVGWAFAALMAYAFSWVADLRALRQGMGPLAPAAKRIAEEDAREAISLIHPPEALEPREERACLCEGDAGGAAAASHAMT